MTRHDEAATYADLLARLGDDGTKELLRRLLEDALQGLIDAELSADRGWNIVATMRNPDDGAGFAEHRCSH